MQACLHTNKAHTHRGTIGILDKWKLGQHSLDAPVTAGVKHPPYRHSGSSVWSLLLPFQAGHILSRGQVGQTPGPTGAGTALGRPLPAGTVAPAGCQRSLHTRVVTKNFQIGRITFKSSLLLTYLQFKYIYLLLIN